ncbi:uncharacterized protein LOC131939625 [Physella acuta]|uniref:uncharacterized protein LOC131939625 n=1 Tax=Physella acuta TaxID=109671 RepID=UPI0027DDC62D|nr:uncharacterized protein LOC131939625 [Physella acuta]
MKRIIFRLILLFPVIVVYVVALKTLFREIKVRICRSSERRSSPFTIFFSTCLFGCCGPAENQHCCRWEPFSLFGTLALIGGSFLIVVYYVFIENIRIVNDGKKIVIFNSMVSLLIILAFFRF